MKEKYRGRRLAAVAAATALVFLPLTACTQDGEKPEPQNQTSQQDDPKVRSERALTELAALNADDAKDDCAVFDVMEDVDGLTKELDAESVAGTIGDRLEQTSGLFARLAKVAKDPAEQESWARISEQALTTKATLAQYGGEVLNEETLTSLGDLSLVYSAAVKAHADDVQERCDVDLEALLASGAGVQK
ncbi:hypothetical protein [Leucobacter luti]|uniref:hypothetical protein n=1 Tax=Leucobacter luti TaxID=340320 RepID=UPI003D061227